MTPRRDPPSATRHALWMPATLLLVLALLAFAWWPAWRPVDTGRRAVFASANRAALWERGAYLVHSLGRCEACHRDDDATGGERSRLTLAAAGAGATAARQPEPHGPLHGDADDDARVRWGGRVYASACARCHDEDHRAATRGARWPVSIVSGDDARNGLVRTADPEAARDDPSDLSTPAFDAPPTDAQLMALAAFLRRHAAAMPAYSDRLRVAHPMRS